MTDKHDEALTRELETCINIEAQQLFDIEHSFDEFKADPTIPNAFLLRRYISGWVETKQRYELLHRIKMHGWGQDDTKHE